MTTTSSIIEIELIDLVNLDVGSQLSFEDGVVARDIDGYLVGAVNETSCDCFYRSDNAASALEAIGNVWSGVTLKYYCDTEKLYIGVAGFSVRRKEGETLESSVRRTAVVNGLEFIDIGIERTNLFNDFHPVLVTKPSFDHVVNELAKEAGRAVLRDLIEKAIFDSTEKLTTQWSVFPVGTEKQSIYEWIINRYQLDEREILLNSEVRLASTGVSQC